MTELKGLKFVTTLVLEFKKVESDAKIKYDTYYLHSESIKITSDIGDVLNQSIVRSNIQELLGKG